MKKILRRLSILICGCIVSICAISLFTSNKEVISTPVRDVELVEQELCYSERLKVFSDYNIISDGNEISLEGVKKITESDFKSIQNLADEKISVNDCYISFDFSYDKSNNIVTISAYMNNELGELELDEIKGVAFINDSGEIDAAMNIDGECILLSEMSDAGMIQNCSWFKKLIKSIVVVTTVAVVATATAALVVATAGVAAPALVAAGIGVAGSTAVTTGSLAIGAMVGYTIYETTGKKAIEAALSIDTNDYYSSSSPTVSYNDEIVDSEIKSIMNKYGLTASTINSLVEEFIGDTKNNDNKTVYLGVGEDEYHKIADDMKGIAFKVSDKRWDELLARYTYEGMWLINRAFLNYVIKEKWEIVLVSDPSKFYDKINKKILVENRFYPRELEYLNKYKNADWRYEGPYWRVIKTW